MYRLNQNLNPFHHYLKSKSSFFHQDLARSGAAMVRQVRRLRNLYDIGPRDIKNFDEIRIHSSPQDLGTFTLKLDTVSDPLVKKIANPKGGYTGVVMASGDSEDLMIFLVTNKKLPDGSDLHMLTLTQRT
jgi:hypothetical protein